MIDGEKQNHSNHDQILITLLETARKLQYKKHGMIFIGDAYTTSGHNSDKNKVTAITKIHAPTNRKQVQSFIGMVNYLSKFSAKLSEIVEPIRELAKDKVPFIWGPEHQSAFTQMKIEVASALIFAYYNPKKQTVL